MLVVGFCFSFPTDEQYGKTTSIIIIIYSWLCLFQSICDRAWENRAYLHILYFEKYEFEILNALFFSCGAIQSHQIYYINSVVI